VVDLGDFRTFVVADIPGLIEGAHEGAGLGDRFLRHIERTKLLLHLVDVSSVSGREPVSDYLAVNHELRAYNPELANRPQIVVATKIDALDEPARLESLRSQAAAEGLPFYEISSVTNKGTQELVAAIAAKLDELTESTRQASVIELAL
jgi:GTP-binding protein